MARITEYFSHLLKEIEDSAWVRNEDITFREIGENEGYIRGVLDLQNGYQLHVAEYVMMEGADPVTQKYRFQLQTSDGIFIARWDNAPHHKEINSFPHHKHCKNGDVIDSSIDTISQMLDVLDDELIDTP